MSYKGLKIVFYDGDCGFCNSTVQFILSHERKGDIFFSPVQSEFAARFFRENGGFIPDPGTFYYYTGHILFSRSTGALALADELKLPFRLLMMLRIIPVCWRDRLYDFVSKRRHRLKKGFCLIPDPSQQKRFLLN